MIRRKTDRYEINVEEIAKGGPGGFESTYLTSIGEPAKSELYDLLSSFSGMCPPLENRIIRQRNGKTLIDALSSKESIGIASGFKPSGPFHFGHKLVSSTAAYFQKNGAQIFIPVADIECDMDKKLPKEIYSFWAADNLVDWGANGVNLNAAHVYLQSEEFRVQNLAYRVARGLSFALAVDTYSIEKMLGDSKKDGDEGEFPFIFAGITQVGDIILPQHSDFGNYHSFMVSGPDQDGHMKMTVSLVEKAIRQEIEIPGLQTTPSGFYIPHVRGLTGNKASSSKPESTIYLGPRLEQEDLASRIKTSQAKFEKAYANPETKDAVERCSLDMVRYIEFFRKRSSVNFGELCQSKEYKELASDLEKYKDPLEAQKKIDNYLIEECRKRGQDNVQVIRDCLKDAISDHYERRKAVIEYASKLSGQKEAQAPDFWKVPEQAVVNPAKRTPTRWYDIVAGAKDKLVP